MSANATEDSRGDIYASGMSLREHIATELTKTVAGRQSRHGYFLSPRDAAAEAVLLTDELLDALGAK